MCEETHNWVVGKDLLSTMKLRMVEIIEINYLGFQAMNSLIVKLHSWCSLTYLIIAIYIF